MDRVSRVRQLKFSQEVLGSLLAGRMPGGIVGLPSDTHVLRVYTSDTSRTFHFLLQSSEFDPVPEGLPAPEMRLVCEQAFVTTVKVEE